MTGSPSSQRVALVASPNPVAVDFGEVGVTTLTWTAEDAEDTEVRVGGPTGPLLSRAGPRGSATTGPWVSDGMMFYLQDVSRGRPLAAEHTLAVVTVRVFPNAGNPRDQLEAVGTAVSRHLGARPRGIALISTRVETRVYAVDLPAERVVVKATADASIAAEAWVLERVRERGVPAPRVLALDTARTTLPYPYMIMQRVPGLALSACDRSSRQDLRCWRQAGESLRLIHGTPAEGYGPLDADACLRTGRGQGRRASWTAAVLQPLTEALAYMDRHALLDGPTVAMAHRFLDAHALRLEEHPGRHLLHGDLHGSHLFGDPARGRLTGIIDFSLASVGDPWWDLAGLALWETAPVVAQLLAGYQQGGDPMMECPSRTRIYQMARTAMVISWCHQRGVPAPDLDRSIWRGLLP